MYFSVLLKDIALKTKEIFTNLAPFSEVSDDGGKIVLSVEALKQKRFPPATENFLYHLAAAEQMLKIWLSTASPTELPFHSEYPVALYSIGITEEMFYF